MIETFATALAFGCASSRACRDGRHDHGRRYRRARVPHRGEPSCRWGIPADRTRRRDLSRVRQRHPHAGEPPARVPFTNCTNCGPRFTIIEDIPYDRPLTTMRHFTMCTACRQEYEDPRNRRFHAQPNACPACGPRLWYADAGGEEITGDPINLAAASIASGEIVALKGLGGFQLCCDATCEAAVTRLRDRKHRPAKPFAVMLPTIAAVRRICHVSDEEAALLEGSARPIVLLQRTGSGATGVRCMERGRLRGSRVTGARRDVAVHADAPPAHARSVGAARHDKRQCERGADREGQRRGRPSARRHSGPVSPPRSRDLCAIRRFRGSSGRRHRSDGPACSRDTVRSRSASTHARTACWRSAPTSRTRSVSCMRATRSPVRTSVTSTARVRSSHHDEALRTYLRLFRTSPATVAADLHPDYASTHLAERWWEAGAREVRVQHHHAHIASVLAEHGLRGNVLGVAFDGVGLGPDHVHLGRRVPALRRTFLPAGRRISRRCASLAGTPARATGGAWRSHTCQRPVCWEMRRRNGSKRSTARRIQRQWRLVSRACRLDHGADQHECGPPVRRRGKPARGRTRFDLRGRSGHAARGAGRHRQATCQTSRSRTSRSPATPLSSTPCSWSGRLSMSVAAASRRPCSPPCFTRALPAGSHVCACNSAGNSACSASR